MFRAMQDVKRGIASEYMCLCRAFRPRDNGTSGLAGTWKHLGTVIYHGGHVRFLEALYDWAIPML